MRKEFLLIGSVVLLMNSGCATVGQTTLLGAGMGAAAGTGIGLAAQRSVGSAAIGAAVGGVIGAGLFYLGAKDHERKEAFQRSSKFGSKEDEIPFVTRPEVTCQKIEGKTESEGTLWIGPHLRCQIKKQSVWSK